MDHPRPSTSRAGARPKTTSRATPGRANPGRATSSQAASPGKRNPRPATSTPAKRGRKQRVDTTVEISQALHDLSNIDFSFSDDEADYSGSGFSSDDSIRDRTVEMDDVIDSDSDGDSDDAGGPRGHPTPRPRQGTAEVFAWSDADNFQPTIPPFDRDSAGIQDAFPVVDENAREVEYFEAFFDEEVMGLMRDQTNLFFRYEAEQAGHMGHSEEEEDDDPQPAAHAAASPGPFTPPLATPRQHTHGRPRPAAADTTPGGSKMKKWVDTTIEELYSFLALLMLMAHVKKSVLKEYWTQEEMTATPFFSKFMARDRFVSLLRYLHFSDNRNPNLNDRLWKIRDFFNLLRERSMSFFQPFQKVVIDESLVLFRGRVVFRQYIPSKRHRFGIKFFVICDCETGYVLDQVVYTASDIDIPRDDPHGFSGAVVKKLMDRYLGKDHVLYTDNYYTSPLLSKYLLEHGTGSCGTVRANRRHFPKFNTGVPQGTVQRQQADGMLALAWQDKRQVKMLSTVHRGDMVNTAKKDRRTGETVKKPDAVVDYNINMRLVDKADMQVGSIECVRKCVKWYKKMFLHLIDITVLNAYNLYMTKTGNKIKLRVFSKNIIAQLLEKYGVVQEKRKGRPSLQRQPQQDRLQAKNWLMRHHLAIVPPPPPPGTQKLRGQRQCYVCAHTSKRPTKRRDVTTWCQGCDVGLCVECYYEYHTCEVF